MNIENRPWGRFIQFAENIKCTVKLLEVNPHQRLSLQKHKERIEQWYFLGSGMAQIGKKIIRAESGQLVNINRNIAHRLIAGKKKLQVLEISFGYFDEKDEIRLEDDYGRC